MYKEYYLLEEICITFPVLLTFQLEVEPETTRETWMTELPPELGPGLGLSARQFKGNKSTSTGDRSVWTDTPADRAKKLKVSFKSLFSIISCFGPCFLFS